MFNTKTYDSTNNNYNTNFDTYIIGNNNIPADGVKYYSNKFGQVMTSFMVDNGDSVLGGNLIFDNVDMRATNLPDYIRQIVRSRI